MGRLMIQRSFKRSVCGGRMQPFYRLALDTIEATHKLRRNEVIKSGVSDSL